MMKKFIFILFVFLAIQAKSQQIDYFANDPKWRISFTWGGAYPCLQDRDYTYYLDGHDTINGDVYNRLYRIGRYVDYEAPSPYPNPNCSGTYEFAGFVGLFRQKGKRIYGREGNQDVMYYEFNLKVGDTLPDSPLLFEDNIYVSAIDSILIGEAYRKVFTLHTSMGYYEPIMIEGIGFIRGFLSGFPDYFYPEQTICFALDDEIVYSNNQYGGGCEIFVGAPKLDKRNQQITIFPNPSNGHFKIQVHIQEAMDGYLNIIDISGRYFMHENWKLMIGENEKHLDLTDLKPGLYFVTIAGTNGEVLLKNKILIE